MCKVLNPEPIQETIALDKLLFEVMKKKEAGLRLSQICVSYINEKYELSYSFADDESFQYTVLRVVIDLYEEVPSICKIYPYAIFYENEIAELYDVNVEMIDLDFHGKFYRIEKEAPMLPEGALEKKAQEEAEAKKRAEAAAEPAPEAQTEEENKGGNN
ncbi:NADH-quinone oxidoreductase subunit C [Butyrivibrio sp. MC2013]|uniref:NADH-quinone oxidoreductase subunit C n=1 Tax=Butyrivibrio sp. MC2013 TaxID=1280686 RepID=UPI00042A8551|nr:NADH-quinone oxidoreductase subunit C [Butyrivibrio sp. MC2013]